ncbi:hypothetical protein GCM10027174_41180 [Salinifilum aidingensis]
MRATTNAPEVRASAEKMRSPGLTTALSADAPGEGMGSSGPELRAEAPPAPESGGWGRLSAVVESVTAVASLSSRAFDAVSTLDSVRPRRQALIELIESMTFFLNCSGSAT